MDRLSIYLTLMTGAVITGTLVIVLLTLGYYGWVPLGIIARAWVSKSPEV